MDNWVHLHPGILQLGRTTHWVDPRLTEEQKQAASDELTEKDPEIERLKSIAEEKCKCKILINSSFFDGRRRIGELDRS